MEPRRHRILLRRLPYLTAKAILNFLRTIPEMLWALIFVFLVGLGPFPGVLALGVHTGGVLGKLFAEVLEDVDLQPIESLQSTGAGKIQILFYGILPQVLPQFVSYTLYRWEVNIRVARGPRLRGRRRIGSADTHRHEPVPRATAPDAAIGSLCPGDRGGLSERVSAAPGGLSGSGTNHDLQGFLGHHRPQGFLQILQRRLGGQQRPRVQGLPPQHLQGL